jgi:hypothetical protein
MLRPDGTPDLEALDARLLCEYRQPYEAWDDGWRILRAIMLEDGRQVPLTDPGATW